MKARADGNLRLPLLEKQNTRAEIVMLSARVFVKRSRS
jgi:hypothetical protein